jgi:hypothetical protein
MRPDAPIAATGYFGVTLIRMLWHNPERCGKLADTSRSARVAFARASCSGVGAAVGAGFMVLLGTVSKFSSNLTALGYFFVGIRIHLDQIRGRVLLSPRNGQCAKLRSSVDLR